MTKNARPVGRMPKRHQRMDWRNKENWRQHPELSLRSTEYVIGDPTTGNALLLLFAEYGPEATVNVHSHLVDYASIVLSGSIEVTRRIEEVGSIRLVSAGTAYGPLRAGPEGCTVLDVFALGEKSRDAIKAQYLGGPDEATL